MASTYTITDTPAAAPAGTSVQPQPPYSGADSYAPSADAPAYGGGIDAPDRDAGSETPAPAPAPQPQQQPPLTIPDDHPLMRRLAQLEEENRSVKTRTDTWQQQIDAAQQTEQRRVFEQTFQQDAAALKAWAAAHHEATGEPVPDEQMGRISETLQYGMTAQTPEFKQRITDLYTGSVRGYAWMLASQHFGPTATVGTIQEAVKTLTGIAPEAMAQVAPMLAERWRNSNVQRRQSSGAERIEGGGPSAGGVGISSDYDRYQQALRSGGPMPFTPEQIDRILAARYR